MTKITGIKKQLLGADSPNGISLELADKKIHAVYGDEPSGTYLLSQIIAGVISPDAGTVTVREKSAVANRSDALVCYVPCGAPAYGDMTVGEYVSFIAEAKGLSASRERRAAVTKALDICDIACISDIMIKKLSCEARIRIDIAAAITITPDILILENPLLGLDENEQKDVTELIKKLKKICAVAVFGEVQDILTDICDTVTLVCDGKITYSAPILNAVDRERAKAAAKAVSIQNNDSEVATV